LRFRLLSDQNHDAIAAYKVWKDGMLLKGIERSTFLITPDGHIAAVWRKVKVLSHVDEVKETLRELTGSEG
ncbi:MAG TPA: redoxin domain-containing protein, partial [Methanoregulaceae archaeon]|nr:redoxin domain-containing protein [Methanoregulaceae archaeon]